MTVREYRSESPLIAIDPVREAGVQRLDECRGRLCAGAHRPVHMGAHQRERERSPVRALQDARSALQIAFAGEPRIEAKLPIDKAGDDVLYRPSRDLATIARHRALIGCTSTQVANPKNLAPSPFLPRYNCSKPLA